jgi:hypothetical protein
MTLEALSSFLKRFNNGFSGGPDIPAIPLNELRTSGKTRNIFIRKANLA